MTAGTRTDQERGDTVLFLWLNSEGWLRFGPFTFVTFHDHAIVANGEHVVAVRIGEHWLCPDKHAGMTFRSPMVTTSDTHPHPDRGAT